MVEIGQREGIGRINPCPQTPSIKRSLKPQGIKKSLNLHVRPSPIIVAFSLALILMAGGLVIIRILTPIEVGSFGYYSDRFAGLRGFASFMWFLVITLLAGLTVGKHVSMVEESKALATSTLVGEERIVE